MPTIEALFIGGIRDGQVHVFPEFQEEIRVPYTVQEPETLAVEESNRRLRADSPGTAAAIDRKDMAAPAQSALKTEIYKLEQLHGNGKSHFFYRLADRPAWVEDLVKAYIANTGLKSDLANARNDLQLIRDAAAKVFQGR